MDVLAVTKPKDVLANTRTLMHIFVASGTELDVLLICCSMCHRYIFDTASVSTYVCTSSLSHAPNCMTCRSTIGVDTNMYMYRYVSLFQTLLCWKTRYIRRFSGANPCIDSVALLPAGTRDVTDTFRTPNQSGLTRHICVYLCAYM